MSIVAGLTTSFRVEAVHGLHLPSHEYALALYGPTASLHRARTPRYVPTGEVMGQGYEAGGRPCGGYTVGVIGEVVTLDWQLPVWDVATITARGGLLYNLTANGASVAVLDFGRDVASQNGPWRIDQTTGPLVRWR